MNQELAEYIKKAKEGGQSNEQIKEGLLGAGWKAENITNYMNQKFNKLSFISGLIILFIIFVSILGNVFTPFEVSSGQQFITAYNTILATVNVLLIILAILSLIIIFRAYLAREPHTYFIVNYLGILLILYSIIVAIASLPLLLFSGGDPKLLLFYLTPFVAVVLFCLYFMRYQKSYFISDSDMIVKKDVLQLFAVSIAILIIAGIGGWPMALLLLIIAGIVEGPPTLPLGEGPHVPTLPLAFLLSLLFVGWWRKKISSGALRSFIFLPGFVIIISLSNIFPLLGLFAKLRDIIR